LNEGAGIEARSERSLGIKSSAEETALIKLRPRSEDEQTGNLNGRHFHWVAPSKSPHAAISMGGAQTVHHARFRTSILLALGAA
jgi:hypothetical protein